MRGASERGATLVETALVISLFFALLFGLIDLGLGVFQTSQASAAARDGARFAVLHPGDEAGIRAQVEARLVGQEVESLAVTCHGADGATKDCASVGPGDGDRVRVAVGWAYRPLTFVGAPFAGRRIEGGAAMVVLGSPVSTGPTPAPGVDPECALVDMTVTPATVALSGVKLSADVYVTVTTNASPTCNNPVLQFDTGKGSNPKTLGLTVDHTTGQLQAIVAADAFQWRAGTTDLEVRYGTGSVLGSRPLTVTVS